MLLHRTGCTCSDARGKRKYQKASVAGDPVHTGSPATVFAVVKVCLIVHKALGAMPEGPLKWTTRKWLQQMGHGENIGGGGGGAEYM